MFRKLITNKQSFIYNSKNKSVRLHNSEKIAEKRPDILNGPLIDWTNNSLNILSDHNISFEYVSPIDIKTFTFSFNNKTSIVQFFLQNETNFWSVENFKENKEIKELDKLISYSKIYEYDIKKLPFIEQRNPNFLKRYLNYIPSVYIIQLDPRWPEHANILY